MLEPSDNRIDVVKTDVLPCDCTTKTLPPTSSAPQALQIPVCQPNSVILSKPNIQQEKPNTQDNPSTDSWNPVLITTLKILALFLLLYLFICSLDILASSFRLIGSRAAGQVISNSDLLKNPIVGLMIGLLVTVLVQSSSTSTSIFVTMVGSDLITVRNAIPIIMGANIGTTVTNTIVSLLQSSDREEFRLSFAAATVHDMFNWLTVLVLLPIEIVFHYLENLTGALMNVFEWQQNNNTNIQLLNRFTRPLTQIIIELDKSVLNAVASGDANLTDDVSLVRRCCDYDDNNSTVCLEECFSLAAQMDLSDTVTGIILLAVSMVILCLCLILMVKLLHSMLKGQIAVVIKKINADFEFPYSVLVNYLSILIGCGMTILVQSSSIFTSALTPLAGIGVITLERIYPLTLGSNIGTTTTGIFAALAADSQSLRNTLQLAFCHLFFNLTGIIIFYPIPFMRLPIPLARLLGNTTAQYRWFSVAYLLIIFFILPLLVLSLSLIGTWALIGVGGPILLIVILVVVINILQSKKPSLLPVKLQNWDFLPDWMHSLEPADKVVTRMVKRVRECCWKGKGKDGNTDGCKENGLINRKLLDETES